MTKPREEAAAETKVEQSHEVLDAEVRARLAAALEEKRRGFASSVAWYEMQSQAPADLARLLDRAERADWWSRFWRNASRRWAGYGQKQRERAERAEVERDEALAKLAVVAVGAEHVADVHWMTTHRGNHCVGCGWRNDRAEEDSAHAYRRHVAETAWAAALVDHGARVPQRVQPPSGTRPLGEEQAADTPALLGPCGP